MNDETLKGRLTQGIIRKGGTIHRPMKSNSSFVHRVLTHLAGHGVDFTPRFLGVDAEEREILTYLEGEVPVSITPDEAQCTRAGAMIRALHDALSDFPGCTEGQTVLHGDLHPGNFVWLSDMPCGVFDWDMARIGDPLCDLAFAVWMWVDVNDEQDNPQLSLEAGKLHHLLEAYGFDFSRSGELCARMIERMREVQGCIYPTPERTEDIHRWCENCIRWVTRYARLIGVEID